MPRIVVIGAGITGVTTAYALARRGYEVTVHDRHRYAAMQTSFANGGQLSASNAEVWNTTATVLKGIRWMWRRDAPLLVHPKPDWHKLSWMAEFIGQIPRYEKNTIETVKLALAAREHLDHWASEEGIEFDHEARGILHVYTDRRAFDHASRVNALLARGGLQREAVDETRMKEIEPALSGRYVGGYFTKSDSSGDIHRFTRGLAAACERKGVTFHYDSRVQSVERLGDTIRVVGEHGEEELHDGVVIAAGVESRTLAAGLGDRVNIYPVKGYSITVPLGDAHSRSAAPWVSLLDDQAKIVSSRLGEDRFRIAGTAEFGGRNLDIRDDRIQPLVGWCRQHFPAIETENIVPWAGLRPMLPSMMPRVGAGRHRGVFYNTGHGHLGWTLAPATAELVAESVLSRIPPKTQSTVVAAGQG